MKKEKIPNISGKYVANEAVCKSTLKLHFLMFVLQGCIQCILFL